ncbi:RNA polymerase sigma factor [Aquimarina hainanensis]|uniref:RNA polymerase sigma factor n=1 Tax=Aquimarina hainanensis TaxID=1578017 RepID=A0ABW5N8X0_9FLAO
MEKDQVIITGIINGNEKILTRFYDENIRYIQGYVLRNHGKPEDVEDVFQDALMVLYQKLNSGIFELTGSIRTYFYGICKNIWRNQLRRKPIFTDGKHMLEETTYDSLLADIENQEREQFYKKYFQQLSTDNKQLLYLFFEGKSMKEIAQITGYSEIYTRKKKFLAKKKLLEMMEQDPLYNELRAVS